MPCQVDAVPSSRRCASSRRAYHQVGAHAVKSAGCAGLCRAKSTGREGWVDVYFYISTARGWGLYKSNFSTLRHTHALAHCALRTAHGARRPLLERAPRVTNDDEAGATLPQPLPRSHSRYRSRSLHGNGLRGTAQHLRRANGSGCLQLAVACIAFFFLPVIALCPARTPHSKRTYKPIQPSLKYTF